MGLANITGAVVENSILTIVYIICYQTLCDTYKARVKNSHGKPWE